MLASPLKLSPDSVVFVAVEVDKKKRLVGGAIRNSRSWPLVHKGLTNQTRVFKIWTADFGYVIIRRSVKTIFTRKIW